MSDKYSPAQKTMIAIFEQHVKAEIDGDLETTMNTMSADPHLINVPNHMGGFGYEEVRLFYRNHLVGKFFPEDMKMERISLTVGFNQIVDELLISFTHTCEIEWLLPGIQPTNRFIEIGFAVIVGFEGNKITHEHIYWDQASVLVQAGLIHSNLPVAGPEAAQRLRRAIGHRNCEPSRL